jgi:flagella basal body P-ring formation protein FlgA
VRVAVAVALLLAASSGGANAERFEIDPDLIRDRLESAFHERAVAGITLEVREVPALIADGESPTVEVLLPEEIQRPGPSAVTVQCRSGGRVTARGLATVLVRARLPVWIPIRSLRRGEVLDPLSLRREERTFDRDPLRLFVLEPKARWRMSRGVDPGVFLRASDVRRLPDVEAGDEIRLVSQAGQAEVSVVGRVRRGGNVGEMILVVNPVSSQIVRARLTDFTTARLETVRESRTQERTGQTR